MATNKQKKTTQVSANIWEAIKDKPLNVFGLPNQTVADFVYLKQDMGQTIIVSLKAQAVLPVLEEVLNSMTLSTTMNGKEVSYPMFKMQENEKYLLIMKNQPPELEEPFKAPFVMGDTVMNPEKE